MKKLLIFLACIFLIQLIINNYHEKEEDLSVSQLYEEMNQLEKMYDDKLLKAYHINIDELNDTCHKDKYSAYGECKKSYIIEHTDLTEEKYDDIFIHPLQQLKESKEKTIDELKSEYDEIKAKIDKVHDLMNLIN